MSRIENLPYNPNELERELKPFYISASEDEISEMMQTIGVKDFKELYSHIPANILMEKGPTELGPHLEYEQLVAHVEDLAAKNNIKTSFIGDGLQQYQVPSVVPFVCDIRGLTTAYTPYQPERSQGTLWTLWMYSSTLSMLTGFEAINASFYDRSTCLFEACNTATRIKRNTTKVIISEGIYPGDMEVLRTQAIETNLELITLPIDKETGLTDIDEAKALIEKESSSLAGFAFCQVNNLGLVEDVNALTDLCTDAGIQSIAIIDPMLLATEGLLPPVKYGSQDQGADMIVGEGQHLAIGPNWGGPGLGIFGIRYNERNKTAIRSTAGRYIGKGKDGEGKTCLSIVLSTREQHIRREKATSNICSNQSFLASAAGAGILGRGENGMTEAMMAGRELATQVFVELSKYKEFTPSFPHSPFFNEIIFTYSGNLNELMDSASSAGIHLGVDISSRLGRDGQLKMSFSDLQNDADLEKLTAFLDKNLMIVEAEDEEDMPEIPGDLLRTSEVGLPNFTEDEIKKFYTELGSMNVSPDDNIYPLGSCTMKYNPYINDYAAGLKGFTDTHPQAPESDTQANLEILFETQEMFKSITGLPGVVTQPVAGAQGELVGLKLFQAYHRDNGNADKKDIVLIPRSAHGTNPATATMAGFETKKVGGVQYGIITIEANQNAEMDFDQLKSVVAEYGERIAGIMVTNPNTAGIFETQFKEMADLIHSVDGLVYMDGANMNAIAGWVDLDKMGVDAVHNNLHKTWTIPHGGGGPGDAIVGVSAKLLDYIPGIQVKKVDGKFISFRAPKTIGSFHRHHGNFAHKVRCYTYIKALGTEGVKKMSAMAVLSAKYLYHELKDTFPTLPSRSESSPRMHEFILTLTDDEFAKIANAGTVKSAAIAKIGKLFLDFGLHAPTVAFPEIYGLMVEPTESFTKKELDDFIAVVKEIKLIINEHPQVLITTPHFTPIKKVDEVSANKNLDLFDNITSFPNLAKNIIEPGILTAMKPNEVTKKILSAHESV
ncbi:aminomethyl-transferring glycine dehydrogenase subunit GcvPB [Halobacteriovorax sp. JY17]|uniref:aminomethyl-transferring glycine dehydrogenase subunit GcvPB n=1 Tax=Halobacteriovorax sp. JY17 TaxID=2014617 RepID=UPI000C60E607|nr:aminomethyl-transferring glycine dehydrogenase subunit GcvPB [Halobacteriovorax sp. JY17]PIK15799.1 MAG: glycine dehydrogenase [Halobacteriovorax sp. JY17]